MIKIADTLWIGESADGRAQELVPRRIGACLNVAQDLWGMCGWMHGIEYMQVGLIDGPGNTLDAYYAAVLALSSLLKRRKTLVYCHTGGRSLAVVIMYLGARAGHGWPGDWSATWEGWLELLSRQAGVKLPVVNDVHRQAFDEMNWRLLSTAMED